MDLTGNQKMKTQAEHEGLLLLAEQELEKLQALIQAE
jgi:hypothetical protein